VFGSGRPCRKVLLVKPLSLNEADLDGRLARHRRYYNYPPYGLGILCTHLKASGYEVEILDLNMEVLALAHRGTDQVQDIERHWQDRLTGTLERFDPDVVGVTCTFTMTHAMMIRVADWVKAHRPGLPVVVGGVHVSTSPEGILTEGRNIDMLVLYEGDQVFVDMLEFINGRRSAEDLAQMATLIDDRFVTLDPPRSIDPTDINVIPDYRDLPIGDYRMAGEIGAFRYWLPEQTKAGIVLSNRGCRGRCAFCTVWRLHHKRVRCRRIESVITEIEQLRDRYGITHITWLDDDLLYNSRRAIRLFNEIVKRGLGITWDASNGVIMSAVAACPEIMDAAVESGCIGILFGIESGNPGILRQMRKPSKVGHALKVGQIMKRFPKVFARGFLMIGFPGETLGQIVDTLTLAQEMDLDWYTVSLLTPLPSTDVYEQMVHDGLIEQTRAGGSRSIADLLKFVGYGYAVRHGASRRAIERQGSRSNRQFVLHRNLGVVPSREELNDLWLIADYKVNYEKILAQDDPLKLRKMERFLTDVCDRMTTEHPLANLFLAIVHERLGDGFQAGLRKQLSARFLAKSQYGQQFFDALDLRRLYQDPDQDHPRSKGAIC